MRNTLFLMLAAACVLAAGCSSGSTSAPAGADAMVLGKVVSRDGSTADLAGVRVLSPETGRVVVTDAAGDFRLVVPAGRTLRLRFEDGAAASGLLKGDVSEGKDDTPDNSDIDGDEIKLAPLGKDEVCEVEVELKDGEIIESWIGREGKGHEGESRLDGEHGCAGEFEIECGDQCCRMEVEIEGLEGPNVYEIVLQSPEGDEITIGTIEISLSGKGDSHYVVEICVGDDVVLEPSDLKDMAGWKILVIDAEGTVVLSGGIPGLGPQHKDRDRHAEDFKLLPPDLSPEPNGIGWGIVKVGGDCESLIVEVGELESTTALEVILDCDEGDEISLGDFEIDEKGSGRFEVKYCEGDELPYGVESLADLAGCALLLVDGEANVVLKGELPDLEKDHDWPDWKIEDFRVEPPDLSPEPNAFGGGIVKLGGDCEILVIEVGELETTSALEAFVVEPEGDEVSIGDLEIGEKGGGRLFLEYCGDDAKPFGVTSLADLGGYAILLVNGEGDVVLAGELPVFETE